MKREELEALGTPELQRLVADATAVIVARREEAAAAPGGGSVFKFGEQGDSPAGQQQGTFKFGLASTGAGGGAAEEKGAGGLAGGSLFAPPARAPVFDFGGAPAPSNGTGKLFGGTGGGLFAGMSTAPAPAVGSLFSSATAVAAKGTTISDAAAQSFGGAVAEAAKAAEGAKGGDDEDEFVPEEEVTAITNWTPSMTLKILERVETGEEEEEQLYKQRSKLYRFRDGEWKERGLGDAKLLKSKESGRVRFLLRQEGTGKVVANHLVFEHETYCNLHLNAESSKIWVWVAPDWAEGRHDVERFGLKFGTEEFAKQFQEAFVEAKAASK